MLNSTEEGQWKDAKHNISDYSDTDYRKDFWEQKNRDYEDYVERLAIRKLCQNSGTCLEIGAGYGRLVDEYAGFFNDVCLVDYAPNLLEQADKRIRELGLKNCRCLRGNLYELDTIQQKFDCAISIRVLHHVENVEDFFLQVNSVLAEKGIFILEFANKRNILEIFRFLSGKANIRPFDYSPGKRGDGVYYNFHPQYVEDLLTKCGFSIEKVLSVSLFRCSFLKKIVPFTILAKIENALQAILACLKLSPSIFIKARKTRDVF